MSGVVIHIAGIDVQVGSRVRQRCSWCGAVLMDFDLATINVEVGSDPKPPRWEPGRLVARDGVVSYVVTHRDGDRLPHGSCGLLDPAVTA